MMEDKTPIFLRMFANIPEQLREDIIVVIDKKPYTWNTAYLEVREKTPTGKKVLKTLEEMEIV